MKCHIHGETLASLGLTSISRYHVTSRPCREKSEASAAPGSEGSLSEPNLRNSRSRAGEVKNEQLTATCAHVCVRARATVDFPAQACSWKVRQIFDCFKPLYFGVLWHSSADHRSTPSPALCRAAAHGSLRTLFYPTGARSCVPTDTTGFRESRPFSVYGTAAEREHHSSSFRVGARGARITVSSPVEEESAHHRRTD